MVRLLVLGLLSVLSVVICSTEIYAQEKSDSVSISDKSFLFQIGSNFTLSNFNGATFAFQKRVDENTANRFYIRLNGEYSTGEQGVDRYNSAFRQGGMDTVRVQDFVNNSNDDFFINSTIGWIRVKYRSFNDNIRYYGGFGVSLNYSYLFRSETMNIDGTYYTTGKSLVVSQVVCLSVFLL